MTEKTANEMCKDLLEVETPNVSEVRDEGDPSEVREVPLTEIKKDEEVGVIPTGGPFSPTSVVGGRAKSSGIPSEVGRVSLVSNSIPSSISEERIENDVEYVLVNLSRNGFTNSPLF